MRKIILILAILFLGTAIGTAQESFRFGAKGGANFSKFSGDGFIHIKESTKSRIAYHFGFFAEIPIFHQFYFQPEILYSAQGYKIKGFDSDQETEFKLDYLTLPLMAKINLIKGLNLEAGPQVAFLINNDVDLIRNYSYDSDLYIKDLDFSVGFGLSYQFHNIFLYGRYNASVINSYDFGEHIDAKNAVIQLGIGYML